MSVARWQPAEFLGKADLLAKSLVADKHSKPLGMIRLPADFT